MIDQGASELDIVAGVLNEGFERAIRSMPTASIVLMPVRGLHRSSLTAAKNSL